MSEYASYIANLNGKTSVTATEDIVTDKGVLLAKAGSVFNEKTYNSILNFKLLKPLEDSIFLEFQLNPKTIHEQIIARVEQDPSLRIIHSQLKDHSPLKKSCARLNQFPILLQKLTVLDMELTDVFFQSLVSAYCAHAIAVMKRQSQEVIDTYFLAGILHDIGLLHIDRYILAKKERLIVDEWRKVQSHPLIGYQIVKILPAFPKSAAVAIVEHHEKTDGSGYPRNKKGDDLSELGQLISLLDNVIVIYNRKLKPIQRSMSSIIPILQINMHSYFPEAVSSTFKLLKQIPTTIAAAHVKPATLAALTEYVYALKVYINKLDGIIKYASEQIGLKHTDKALYNIQNEGHNIDFIMRCAGLSVDDSLDWGKSSNDEETQTLYAEVDDARLLLEEILYNLNGYQKSINVFVDQNPQSKYTGFLKTVLDVFAELDIPKPNQSLQAHWDSLS